MAMALICLSQLGTACRKSQEIVDSHPWTKRIGGKISMISLLRVTAPVLAYPKGLARP